MMAHSGDFPQPYLEMLVIIMNECRQIAGLPINYAVGNVLLFQPCLCGVTGRGGVMRKP